jgi:glutaredoxin
MEFEKPIEKGFTIYSKSGCINCNQIKTLLIENKMEFKLISCDEYILEDKENFLLFIKQLTNKDQTQFPFIFNNSEFIGSFNQAKEYIFKYCLTFDNNSF